MVLVGDVSGKIAILVDDMIDTGTTLALAARTLADNGAAKTYAIVSHGASFSPLVSVALPNLVFLPGLLSETNMKMIEELPIEQLVVRPASASLKERPPRWNSVPVLGLNILSHANFSRLRTLFPKSSTKLRAQSW